MYIVKISVRNLVESILYSGDIGSELLLLSPERAEIGSKVHRLHQKNMMEEKSEYIKEYYLKTEYESDDIKILLDGRADGLVPWEYIEEIKSTYRPLEELEENDYPLHWAQLKFYGYMAMQLNEIEKITLRLTYFNIDSEDFRSFDSVFTKAELTAFAKDVLDKFVKLKSLYFKWIEKRNISIKGLKFPFYEYRPGQRKMSTSIYGTIKENKRMFIQAPTGIGKTISALFPSIKALGEKKIDRIFYLTPKGTGKAIGEESIMLLRQEGGKLRSITLTSKEKICFMDEVKCNAEYCPYAKGHYDRVMAAVIDILENEEALTRETVEEYSKKHMVCPFEYSLELSLYADIIIGDYNYAFDPRVYLKRFFDERTEKYTFLIDEAHNLLDRARAMFSAELTKEPFKVLKKEMKGYSTEIKKASGDLDKLFNELGKRAKEAGEGYVDKDYDFNVLERSETFIASCERFFTDDHNQKKRLKLKEEAPELDKLLTDTYFECISLRRITDLYNEGYLTYVTKKGSDVSYKLFCIDPSINLKDAMGRADSQILFSATLTPMDYYMELYGGDEKDYRLKLGSPFDPDNLDVYCDYDIDTRYKMRDGSYEAISRNIKHMVDTKAGNYIAFFPSYKYMNELYTIFESEYKDSIKIKKQEPGMSEKDREDALKEFDISSEGTMVYFMVLGGVFSEGIDLKGESLIGAALIGVGYPQFDYERQLIQDYFEEKRNSGFKYAYTYPGMNKITQAGGRVIRSETDKGVILIMDKRYKSREIMGLLPDNWFPIKDISELNSDTEDELS